MYNSYETKFYVSVVADGSVKRRYLGTYATMYPHPPMEVVSLLRVIRNASGKLKKMPNFTYTKKFRLDREFTAVEHGLISVPFKRKF